MHAELVAYHHNTACDLHDAAARENIAYMERKDMGAKLGMIF
jgi:hypothetical protein